MPRVAERIIGLGANVNVINFKHQTPLYIACQQGHLEVATVFLKGGADWNVPNKEGQLPIEVAAENRHDHLVQIVTKFMNE